jgi:hypothetical protein
MQPRATSVKALDGYRLLIGFKNHEQRVYDMTKMLEASVYQKLKDVAAFANVHVNHGIVMWDDMTDLAPETAYYASLPYEGAPT